MTPGEGKIQHKSRAQLPNTQFFFFYEMNQIEFVFMGGGYKRKGHRRRGSRSSEEKFAVGLVRREKGGEREDAKKGHG